MLKPLIIALALSLSVAPAAFAEHDAVEKMNEYLMFSDYNAGIILPEQIDETVFKAAAFIDTRDAAQFEANAIPGAAHIEWREVLDRIDEIPSEQMTILYCNTGSLSAQAAFALRVAGRQNVVVLQSGVQGWRENAAWKPE